MEADPPCAIRYTNVRFCGWVFQPEKQVGARATKLDGSLQGAPFPVSASGNGVVGTVLLHTESYDPVGVWAGSREGITSHKRIVGHFRLLLYVP